jgi:tetratricopeptide (TPR) repeat protein
MALALAQMNFRQRLRAVVFGLGAVLLVPSSIVALGAASVEHAIGLIGAAIGAWLLVAAPIYVWMIRALRARHARAFEEEDTAAMRAVLRDYESFGHGRGDFHEQLRAAKAEVLLIEERWAEARDALATVDRSRLDPRLHAGVLNNLAWSTALAGDPARAIRLAEQALTATKTSAGGHRTAIRGTLGVAYALDDRPTDAVEALEDVLRAGGSPRMQAIRAFYLGEARHALGQHQAAAAAYRRAIAEQRAGRWSVRAKRALERLPRPA